MQKTITASGMKRLDQLAQEKYAIPSLILMENAGRTSAEEISKRFKKGRGAIFCGKGNNGGDGFVCARYLKDMGLDADIFTFAEKEEIKKKDALLNLTILLKQGAKIKGLLEEKDLLKIKQNFQYDFIVDAIFGIGFKGALPEKIASMVDFLNGVKIPRYAIDVPSGLDADTGKVNGTCMKAHKTITFGLLKKGFITKEARKYTGKIVVKNIGFPKCILNK